MARKVDTLFSVANNCMGPLIGQTIVLASGKNRLTNQYRASTVKDDFYLCACWEVYHSTYITNIYSKRYSRILSYIKTLNKTVKPLPKKPPKNKDNFCRLLPCFRGWLHETGTKLDRYNSRSLSIQNLVLVYTRPVRKMYLDRSHSYQVLNWY